MVGARFPLILVGLFCAALPAMAQIGSAPTATVEAGIKGVVWATSNSISVDSSGNPQIAYTTGTSVKCAIWNGEAWDIQTVDSGTCSYCSIATDRRGEPHIAYAVWPGGLKYATRSAGQWQTQIVEDETDGNSKILLDATDRPYILHSRSHSSDPHSGVDVRLCTLQGSQWRSETVAPRTNMVEYVNLAFDGGGRLHAFYVAADHVTQTTSPFTCHEATRQGAGWQVSSFAPLPLLSEDTVSLTVDRAGQPLAIWATGTSADPNAHDQSYSLRLMLANGQPANPESILHAERDHTALALDSHGLAHLVCVTDPRRLKLAQETPNHLGWTTTDLGLLGPRTLSGINRSLAIDRRDRDHVCYFVTKWNQRGPTGTFTFALKYAVSGE